MLDREYFKRIKVQSVIFFCKLSRKEMYFRLHVMKPLVDSVCYHRSCSNCALVQLVQWVQADIWRKDDLERWAWTLKWQSGLEFPFSVKAMWKRTLVLLTMSQFCTTPLDGCIVVMVKFANCCPWLSTHTLWAYINPKLPFLFSSRPDKAHQLVVIPPELVCDLLNGPSVDHLHWKCQHFFFFNWLSECSHTAHKSTLSDILFLLLIEI